MEMDPRFSAIADHLLLIESELRALNLWSLNVPSTEALSSIEPFSVDTLAFEEWLQWIFLPRMKLILEENHPLPSASGILAMAEMVFAQRTEPSEKLLALLAEFDRLISTSA